MLFKTPNYNSCIVVILYQIKQERGGRNALSGSFFLQGRWTSEPTLLFPFIQFPCTSFSMNCNGNPSLFLLLARALSTIKCML